MKKRLILSLLSALVCVQPALAEISQESASDILISTIIKKQYHDTFMECLEPKLVEYKNAGYTFQVFDLCGRERRLLSQWRVDAESGEIYQQNSQGKYGSPTAVERVNILLVDSDHPYHWIKLLLLERIPAIQNWDQYVKKESQGEAMLGVIFDEWPDPAKPNYEFRIGESHEDHWYTWDYLVLNRITKEIIVKRVNPGSEDEDENDPWLYIPLSEWDRLKTSSPP